MKSIESETVLGNALQTIGLKIFDEQKLMFIFTTDCQVVD